MIKSLARIGDKDSADNIKELAQCFVRQLNPLKIFLFGSFADGTYTDESDYDFYIVIDDGRDVGIASDQAYKSIRLIQRRSVDIVVGTSSRFDMISQTSGSMQIESVVGKKGILLYEKKTDNIKN